MKTFHEISRGQNVINMATLIIFLEDNGFHPRTEDLEAILRRCDHDADRALSYDEFCELTELPFSNELDDESIIHDT
jgi:Ca2+-binding EF-hand superfamily protein